MELEDRSQRPISGTGTSPVASSFFTQPTLGFCHQAMTKDRASPGSVIVPLDDPSRRLRFLLRCRRYSLKPSIIFNVKASWIRLRCKAYLNTRSKITSIWKRLRLTDIISQTLKPAGSKQHPLSTSADLFRANSNPSN